MVDWDEQINFDWLKGGSDERNRFIENLPIIAMFGFMLLIFVPFIPAEIKPWLIFGGFGVAMVVGAISEWALKVKASEYLAIECVVRPSNKKYYLFIDEPPAGLSSASRCIDASRNWYSTPLPLAEAVEYEEYGLTHRWEIEGELEWDKRMHFTPGYVTYKGYPGIRHNKVARITVWEPKKIKGRLDTSNGYPAYIPRFILSEAPRDFYIMSDPAELANVQTAASAMENLENVTDQTLIKDKQMLLRKIAELESQSTALKSQVFNLEQEGERTRSLSGQAVNAYMGSASKEPDIDKLVQTKFIVLAHAFSNIVDAKNTLFGKWTLPKIGMWTAFFGLGLAFLALMGVNTDFRNLIFANLGLLVLGVIGYAIVGYVLKSKVKT